MKTNILKLTTILLILAGFLLTTGCGGKEKPPHAIVGSWRLIAIGFGSDDVRPVENSQNHIEFFQNGKMKRMIDSTVMVHSYEIDEHFLYEAISVPTGIDVNYQKIVIYKYKIDEDTLFLKDDRIDYRPFVKLPQPANMHIYQRINK
jgi:hypothetical protein